MKDLVRCLDEYPMTFLQAIARAWDIVLPLSQPREMAVQLAQAMQQRPALEAIVRGLSDRAREALLDLLRARGALPAHRLAVNYGTVRRLGPARLEREHPWTQPETAIEELYYKGLVYRAYGTVADAYGEIFLIPEQLVPELDQLLSPGEQIEFEELPTPPHSVSDGTLFVEDMFAVLVHLRQARVRQARLRQTWMQSARGEAATGVGLSSQQVDLAGRLTGERLPARLELLRQILLRLHLVDQVRGLLRPSSQARDWLRASDASRSQSAFLAWRDNPHWDELRLLESVRCDDADCTNNPVATRLALLDELAQCPAETWLSLAAFVQRLKRNRPDYLRPDGDYASWPIRDARSGAFLSGFQHWDQIEGALALYIVTAPLRWLGLVAMGYADGASEPYALRITAEGHALLRNEPLAEPAERAAQPAARIQEDMSIAIDVAGTLYDRYQLERFAEWQSQGTEALYRITAESVWRGQNAGIRIEQIVHLLDRISQGQVPTPVLRTLQAWGGRFGRVTLRRGVVLQTVDERTMQQINAQPDLRRLIEQVLAPTMCLVAEENLDELIRRLKALGMWPQFVS